MDGTILLIVFAFAIFVFILLWGTNRSSKCKHPFESLAVYKDSTVVPSPKYPKDYNDVTLHLFCQKCGAGDLEKGGTDGALSIKYAQTLRSPDVVVAEMVQKLQRGETID